MSSLIAFPETNTDEGKMNRAELAVFESMKEMEALWLHIGEVCSQIVREKLYRLRKDTEGNYFRTAEAYFRDLDRRLREQGFTMSVTSLNRFISDHRLYKEELGYEDADLLLLGKSALDEMAPTVRKKLKEAGPEAAMDFVNEMVAAAQANGGLPLSEVRRAVDEVSGRTVKGLEAEFAPGVFQRRLKKLNLYWGADVVDLVHSECSEEQEAWLKKRLGIKPR